MGVMSLSDRLVGKESACNAGNPGLIPGSGRAAREGTAALLAAAHSSILGLPTPVFLGCPLQYSWASLVVQQVENPPAVGETCKYSIPGLGRFPGEGKGYPFQYSGLEKSMDSTVHGVAKSQT